MTETINARLLSVNVGLPDDIAWRGETVHTAVWKHAVSGRCMARWLNLEGDGQGDLIGHGGEQRAILVYRSIPIATGSESSGGMTSFAASSARTSPSKACPMTRCALETATESGAQYSR